MPYRLAVFGHRPTRLGGFGYCTMHQWVRLQLSTYFSVRYGQFGGQFEVASTMGLGVGQWAIQEALALGIPARAYVPAPGQQARWPEPAQLHYNQLLGQCATILCAEAPFAAWKIHAANRSLLASCTEALFIWDGTPAEGEFVAYSYALDHDIPARRFWPTGPERMRMGMVPGYNADPDYVPIAREIPGPVAWDQPNPFAHIVQAQPPPPNWNLPQAAPAADVNQLLGQMAEAINQLPADEQEHLQAALQNWANNVANMPAGDQADAIAHVHAAWADQGPDPELQQLLDEEVQMAQQHQANQGHQHNQGDWADGHIHNWFNDNPVDLDDDGPF